MHFEMRRTDTRRVCALHCSWLFGSPRSTCVLSHPLLVFCWEVLSWEQFSSTIPCSPSSEFVIHTGPPVLSCILMFEDRRAYDRPSNSSLPLHHVHTAGGVPCLHFGAGGMVGSAPGDSLPTWKRCVVRGTAQRCCRGAPCRLAWKSGHRVTGFPGRGG